MDELLKKIIRILKNTGESSNSEKILLKNKEGTIEANISPDAFITFEEGKDERELVTFIDGGNGEIIGGSSFSLQKIRIVSSVFIGKNNQKTNYENFDLLCVNNGDFYDLESNPKQKFIDELDIKSSDFKESSISSIKPDELCGAIRRISELNHVLKLLQNKTAKTIVIDGSLQSSFIQEKKLINKIMEESKKQNVFVVGISKFSAITNDKGVPAVLVLDEMAKAKGISKNWFIYVGTNENIITGFIKLNEDAKIVLRIDYFENDLIESEQLKTLNLLARASKDPIFLGYPYGLIDADDKARITKEELDEETIRLKIMSGKDVDLIENAMATKESHKILDNIRF